MELDTIIILVGTITGGVGLPVVNHFLNKRRVSVSDATQIRKELRDEVLSQREEISRLEIQVDAWREKYYELRDEFSRIKAELESALIQIKREARIASEKLEQSKD